MISIKKPLTLLDICDSKLVKLQKERDEINQYLIHLEQSYILGEMSKRIYNYYHGKYSKRKSVIENSMDDCYLAMVKFEKFEYG